MGTGLYITVESRTTELTELLKNARDETFPQDTHPQSRFDSFYLVGQHLGTKPWPTFHVTVRKSILERLDPDLKLEADDVLEGIETVRDLQQYLRQPAIRIKYVYNEATGEESQD